MTSKFPLILVYSDNCTLLAELLGKARQAIDSQGWKIAVLQTQETRIEDSAFVGADIILQPTIPVSSFEPDAITSLLCQAIEQKQPRLVLLGATRLGLEVAPRVAERLQAGYAPWVTAFDISPIDDVVNASTMLYSGIGTSEYCFTDPYVVLTAALGVFQPAIGEQPLPSCSSFEYQPRQGQVKIIGYCEKPMASASLQQAQIVIDLGQGIKPNDKLDLIKDLAGLLEGQLACTRPIASDRNWFPEWLGLSGMKVSPKLCLALGVSGAIQHMIGIRGAERIVSVNNDEAAAIFSQSDYGIVADLYEFLPVLIDRLKTRCIRPL